MCPPQVTWGKNYHQVKRASFDRCPLRLEKLAHESFPMHSLGLLVDMLHEH